jgi:hypothetical protein
LQPLTPIPERSMNFSTFLDVAISLVFVFFTISMFVSGLVELINGVLEQRSNLLKFALLKLFLGQNESQKFRHILWDFCHKAAIPANFRQFWEHPTVVVKQQRFLGNKPISYLSGDSFSTVIIDLLTANSDKAIVGLDVITRLREVVADATSKPELAALKAIIGPILTRSGTLAEFKTNLERWYDGYMEQVSGWYKRYAQGVVWGVSMIVTLAMNVDTIHITQRLFNDKDLRDAMVAQADQTVQQQTKPASGNPASTAANRTTLRDDTTFTNQLKEEKPELHTALKSGSALTGLDSLQVKIAYARYLRANIDALNLPIGWNSAEQIFGYQWFMRVFGWVLTIAALSFGAPFWFDLLVKLVNIRNTTRKPVSSAAPDSK